MARAILFATLGVALLSPATATAQAKPQTDATPFDTADANHDGRISRAEFLAARNARFDRIDKTHDGVINRADFPKAANHQQALAKIDAHIAAADANHDGSISRAELAGSATPFFDKADGNHDGFVTKAEIAALRQASRPPSP